MSQDPEATLTSRSEPLKLWQYFAGAIAVHAIIIVGLSPSIFTGGEDTSPDGMLKKARRLAQEEKYEQALQVYRDLLNQKPQIPVAFVKADKEMQETRLKMLEKKRKEAQEAQKAAGEGEEGAEGEGEGEEPTGTEEGAGEGEGETVTPPPPPTELPELPGLGED